MEIGWNGLPYNPISNFYRQKFGAKIYKIPVTVVDSCPNRKGFKGMQTCVFCDVWGSAANAESSVMNLRDQITRYQEIIRKKYKAEKFLVYFQAYTNTFTKISQLRENFETALEFPDVVGFVVGTRPDCLSQGVLDLWQEYHQKTFVAVELGVQSFFDDQLEFMRRGHSSLDSWKALLKISSTTSVDLGVHLMFGQPGETDADILLTAKLVNSLPIRNVKLHNLHVLRETPLEGLFQDGQFLPIERELYAQRVQLFLENIRPDIFVQRLAAYSSRWNELVAPAWTADKMGTHQFLIDFLRERQSYQSKSLT
ncbi:MAG: TIGR01212 family radical SAM protein [Bdellovibrionales bacterium]|nr:TIGR01212 family radical SAM protein [Bdellovibrionales bacterium]